MVNQSIQNSLEEIVNEINSNPLLDGITLSGGDPLYNPEEMLEIVKYLKEKNWNEYLVIHRIYN